MLTLRFLIANFRDAQSLLCCWKITQYLTTYSSKSGGICGFCTKQDAGTLEQTSPDSTFPPPAKVLPSAGSGSGALKRTCIPTLQNKQNHHENLLLTTGKFSNLLMQVFCMYLFPQRIKVGYSYEFDNGGCLFHLIDILILLLMVLA